MLGDLGRLMGSGLLEQYIHGAGQRTKYYWSTITSATLETAGSSFLVYPHVPPKCSNIKKRKLLAQLEIDEVQPAIIRFSILNAAVRTVPTNHITELLSS